MKPRKKGGRPPTAFPAAARNELLRLMREGMTPLQAMEHVGVKLATVLTRCHRYPKFKAKYEKAREASLDALEIKMHEMGAKGNLTAIFGMLKANRPDKWRESKHVDLSNKDGTLRKAVEAFVASEVEEDSPRQLRETQH